MRSLVIFISSLANVYSDLLPLFSFVLLMQSLSVQYTVWGKVLCQAFELPIFSPRLWIDFHSIHDFF